MDVLEIRRRRRQLARLIGLERALNARAERQAWRVSEAGRRALPPTRRERRPPDRLLAAAERMALRVREIERTLLAAPW